MKLIENGPAGYKKSARPARIMGLSIGIPWLAYNAHCLTTGQDLPIISPNEMTYPKEVQTASKLSGTFPSIFYVFDSVKSYLGDTIGKPLIKDRKQIYQRIKEKVFSLLPQPIPIDND